jgi:hypothetical protein
MKVISDGEANIQSSKQMQPYLLDQILAYNERQFEDINMRLKSKFTLREKIGNIIISKVRANNYGYNSGIRSCY